MALFAAAGVLLTRLPSGSYARAGLILSTWVIFAVVRYLFRTILRFPIRSILRVTFVVGVGVAIALWAAFNGHLPGYRMLPAQWFLLAWVGGFGCNIAIETLSTRGVPLAWPLRWRIRAPVLGETGGLRDGWAVGALLAVWVGWWWNHYQGFHVFVVGFEMLGALLLHSAQQFLQHWF